MKDGLHVNEDGTKIWYLHGQLHREDGPAIECLDGYKAWFLHGVIHREDGPAIEQVGDTKEWYLHGTQYTEDEFILKTSKFWQKVLL